MVLSHKARIIGLHGLIKGVASPLNSLQYFDHEEEIEVEQEEVEQKDLDSDEELESSVLQAQAPGFFEKLLQKS